VLRPGSGRSKIGGLPDADLGAHWPNSDGTPLTFITQLDLSEIAEAGGPEWLPQGGLLLFFYDMEDAPWGFDPADRGGWSVIFQPAGAPGAAAAGGSEADPFPEVRVRPEQALSLPQPEDVGVDITDLSGDDLDALHEATNSIYADHPAHQVGGFASPIQDGEMELEAQLASNGLYCGNASGYSDPRAADLASGAKDWRLLLQLDSDENADLMWGDCGRLYFWVREEDARNADFSNVWLILQCS
jgi:uncharacterized protein YwqG